MNKRVYVVADQFTQSYLVKEMGLFARYVSRIGIPTILVSNKTPANAATVIKSDTFNLKLLATSSKPGRYPLDSWEFLCYLWSERTYIGIIWLYRLRPYVLPSSIIAKLVGAKVIIKLDTKFFFTPLGQKLYNLRESAKFETKRINGTREHSINFDIARKSTLPARSLIKHLKHPLRLVRLTASSIKAYIYHDFSLHFADVILCESPFILKQIESRGLRVKALLYPASLPITEYTIIRDGFDERGLTKQRIILSVGRIYMGDNGKLHKGFDLLVKAFGSVRSMLGDTEWKLRIIGPVEEQDAYKYLKDLIIQSGFENHVEIITGLYGEDLLLEYHTADIFVLASQSEGQPNVITEAMFFACAIVASNVGTISYQLENNSGMLIKKDNLQELTNSLMSLMSNPSLRRHLSTNAHNRVLTNFSIETNASNVLTHLSIHFDTDK